MIIEWCVTCECCDTDVIVSAAWFKRVLDGRSIVVCERCVPDYERATGNRAVDIMEAKLMHEAVAGPLHLIDGRQNAGGRR